MKETTFDFETIADPDAEERLPPIEPDSRLKDPKKIEENIETKRQKRIETLGLDPYSNLICCASFYDLQSNKLTSFVLEEEDSQAEKDLIQKIWNYMFDYERFISFNGMNFDCRILMLHSMRHRVPMSVKLSRARYRIENHVDVRMVLNDWDARAPGTQDTISKFFLGKGKPEGIEGSLVQHYWDLGAIDKIVEYCEDDNRKLAGVYRMMKGYFL